MKAVRIFLLMIGMLALAGTASATFINPVGGDGANTSLQDVINGLASGGPLTPAVDASGSANDAIAYDSIWSIGATGGSVATFVIELAGNSTTNMFGIYDSNDISKKVVVFDGVSGAGAQSLISIKDDGSVYVKFADSGVDFAGNSFGFFIEGPGGTYYSDTLQNADGFDHMVAFQGKNQLIKLPDVSAGNWLPTEYLLAFEDVIGSASDQDYQDLVVMVESVTPVPEPATMLLLGAGLIGIAAFGRKKLA